MLFLFFLEICKIIQLLLITKYPPHLFYHAGRTSSLVSAVSIVGLARLAILGAVMLEKHNVLSGGGPPRG